MMTLTCSLKISHLTADILN